MLPRDRGERNPQAGLIAVGVVLAINGILFLLSGSEPVLAAQGAAVAVKTLKGQRGGTALLAEAAALCTLQHPNVVRVFGFCPKPDLAVVMEYIVGGSLSQWIASTRDKVSIVVSVLLHL